MASDFPPPPPPSPAPPIPPAPPPPPPQTHRLARSSRERMWAGVAGGMAEYFDLDPSLVRLMWVAATIISGGLAIPVYIIAWIILPRDEQAPTASNAWHTWSQEFHDETRRFADDVRERTQGWHTPGTGTPPSDPTFTSSTSTSSTTSSTSGPPEEPWWWHDRYGPPRPHNGHRHHPKSTGLVLVVLGALLLAANSGLFTFEWRYLWPLIFIGLGVILLARQSGWGR